MAAIRSGKASLATDEFLCNERSISEVKNLSLVLNVVLLAAVAFLFVREFSDSESSKGAEQTSTAKPGVMAYVNIDTLYAYYDYYQEIKSELEVKGKKASTDLESRATKFAKKRDNFVKMAQAGLLSNNEAQKREKELVQEGQELERYQMSAQQGLAAFEQEKQEELYNKVTSFLDEYNAEKGYDYIVGYQRGGNFWYTDDAYDITQDVLKGLNEEYKKEQETAGETAK